MYKHSNILIKPIYVVLTLSPGHDSDIYDEKNT